MELAFEMWAEASSFRLLCYNLFGNHVRRNRWPLVTVVLDPLMGCLEDEDATLDANF